MYRLLLVLFSSTIWAGTVTNGFAKSQYAISPLHFTGTDNSGNDVTADIFATDIANVPDCPFINCTQDGHIQASQVGDMVGSATINGIFHSGRYAAGQINISGQLPTLSLDPSLVGTSIILPFTFGLTFDITMYDTPNPIAAPVLFHFSGGFSGVGQAKGLYEIGPNGPFFQGGEFFYPSATIPEPSSFITALSGVLMLIVVCRGRTIPFFRQASPSTAQGSRRGY